VLSFREPCRTPTGIQPNRFESASRLNTPGHAHYLTFSCFQRRPFLSRDRSRQWLVDAVNRARAAHAFHVWAYVIMPEHAHFIFYPTREDYDISDVLKSIKESVAKKAVSYVKKNSPDFLKQMADVQPNGKVSHRFWQRGPGYDRNLWSPDEVWEKIDYMHNNPVERSLCEAANDWLWSSAADYAGTRNGPLRIDFEHVPRVTYQPRAKHAHARQ